MSTFKAVVIDKNEAGQSVEIRAFDEADLMDGDVTVRVSHSTLNYKDGLAVTGKAPVVRRFPMIPGVDLAGIVEASSNPDFKPGDAVVLNGWGLGETHLGAYAEKVRVKGDWLIPLPQGLSAQQAMAIGTAGYTAMLCLMALERHGLRPDRGPAIVTGRRRRRRLGRRGAARQGRLACDRLDRAAGGGGLSERSRRRRDPRPQRALRSRRGRSPRSAGRPASTPSARPRSPMCCR